MLKLIGIFLLICMSVLKNGDLVKADSLSALSSSHYKFHRYSSEDGLSQTTINAFLQDSRGYMWIGTQDGLNRFDGYEFRVFKHTNSRFSLSDNWVNDLLEIDEKTLWIATELGGLNIFNKAEEAFYPVRSVPQDTTTPSSNKVIRLYRDLNERVWLGTSRGLNLYDPEKNQFIRLESRFKELKTRIYDIAMDSSHHLWLATADGLFVLSSDLNIIEKIDLLPTALIQPGLDRKAFQMSEGELLWIGTHQGLFRLNTITRNAEKITGISLLGHDIGNAQINDIEFSESGKFWLALVDGVCQINLPQSSSQCFQHHRDNPWSIATNHTKSLYFDREGQLWVGGSDSGFAILKSANPGFITLTNRGEAPRRIYGKGVRAVMRDQDGKIWVGHKSEGLSVIDLTRKKVTHLFAGDGPGNLRSNQIRALYDAGDTILVGYLNHWFSVIDKQTGKVRHVDLIRNSQQKHHKPSTVYDFERLADGRFLIATGSAGLFIWHPQRGQLTNYRANSQQPHSLTSNRIHDIFIDDEIWLATRKGLSKFDLESQKFTNYYNSLSDKSDAANRIYAIESDGSGNLWLGTRRGVFRFNPKNGRFTSWSSPAGMLNDTIYAVLQDELGNLWLSTNNGLAKLDQNTKRFSVFYKDDGIQNNEFSAYAFFKDRENNLYFGGIAGLTIVIPRLVREYEPLKNLYITDLKLFGEHLVTTKFDKSSLLDKAVDFKDTITLSSKQSFFALNFSTLNYTAPEKVIYSYRLKGLFENWVTLPAGKRTASFSHLPPGDYTLEYRAYYPNGYWNGENARLAIHILPPIWLSWWAKLTYLLLALVAGVFIYFVAKQSEQVKQLETEKKIAELAAKSKSRFLAVMSHEIRTPLNGIMGMLELLKKTALEEVQLHYLSVAERSGESLLSLVDDILDFSRIEAGKLEADESCFNIHQLADEVLQVFSGIVNTAALKVIASVDPGIEPWLCGDQRKLKQVLVNLIGNAVKFTESGYVTLSIHRVESVDRASNQGGVGTTSKIAFVISDSGIGIPKEKQEYIFENFAQADERINRSYGGSGLGLAISKRLVEVMGGSLQLESQPGLGTTFKFSVKLRSGWRKHCENRALNQVALSKFGEWTPLFRPGEVRLLLIVDNSYVGDFLTIAMARYGIAVTFYEPANLLRQQSACLVSQHFTLAMLFCEDDCSQNESCGLRIKQCMPDLSIIIVRWEHLDSWRRPGSQNERSVYLPVSVLDLVEVLISEFTTHSEADWVHSDRESPLPKPSLMQSPTPATEELQSAIIEAPEAPHSQRLPVNGTVLVAEDNEINQMVISSLLKKLGCQLEIVANGKLALDTYKRSAQAYSLILMDCEMPEMDGLEACQKIRAFEKQSNLLPVPIVALSAHALEEHRRQALACGMNDYVCKPVRMAKIQDVLKQWCCHQETNNHSTN